MAMSVPQSHPQHSGGTNANGHQPKMHQNVAAAAVVQQQQIALVNVGAQQPQQQQKNKLSNADYISHQPSTHQHSSVMTHNYRMSHPQSK